MPNYFFQAARRWGWVCVGPRCITADIEKPGPLVALAMVWEHSINPNWVSNSTRSIFGEILTVGSTVVTF